MLCGPKCGNDKPPKKDGTRENDWTCPKYGNDKPPKKDGTRVDQKKTIYVVSQQKYSLCL